MTTLNFLTSPASPLEKRTELLKSAIPDILDKSVDYTQKKHEKYPLLETCISFIDYDLSDAPSAEISKLRKVWYFPWTEAQREYDSAMNLALCSNYKAAIDHIRRALELIVMGAHFTDDSIDKKKQKIG